VLELDAPVDVDRGRRQDFHNEGRRPFDSALAARAPAPVLVEVNGRLKDERGMPV